uniref:RRP12-like protein isoform X2 n=1 Tax=Rhizophora mucronata TaxID=61149 RepID=A0A2P2LGB5_RHIMU
MCFSLFCYLFVGEMSFIFMNSIVLKLADLMNHAGQDNSDTHHLQKCLGSAVVAMGPQRILELIPISINADDFTCSNTWLVPILKNHVVGASLEYYMEHIVPLAKSFQRAHKEVKKSVIGQDLQAHAQGLWGLLPAFCQYPVDTHKKFGSLADLLIKFLKKDSFMHQHVAFALQVLVNQNKSSLLPGQNVGEFNTCAQKDKALEFKGIPCYSNKTAKKNIRALGSCSTELLQALVDLFVDSLADKRLYMKDAIGCLASVTDSSITKDIFVSLLQRFEVVNSKGEFEKKIQDDETIDEEQGNLSATEKDIQRCPLMSLASVLVEGAGEDLVELIYNFVVDSLQGNHVTGQCEVYHTLSKVLEEHGWFCSSRFMELIDLLLGLEPSTDISSVRHRFACFHTLMVHMLEMSLEEQDTKAFLILNEIIVTLKDAKDEARKVAYDTLLMICSSLKDSSRVNAGRSYHKLISMIMGYLSGSSPHIKSGAVSALSVVVHSDAEVCLKIPDVVPSVLSLLHGKAVEVIKAALGFAKVLVSCLPAKDLQNVLSEVVSGVLPWSSVSRHHFREKVTIILEIITRKCGSAAVEAAAPEKYKRFVKTVFQNRHHKSTSKDAVATNTETSLEDSSIKRSEEQKHNDLGSFPNRQGSVHHRKRKRGIYKGPPDLRAPHITTGDDSGPQDAKRVENPKQKMLVKVPLRDKGEETPNNESNDWKTSMEHKSMRKKRKGALQTLSSTFKHRRHRKLGKQKAHN